jgi:hypothetical protein
MRGGNHDTHRRPVKAAAERDGRRRTLAVREKDRQIVRLRDLRGGKGEHLALSAPVITDHDTFAGHRPGFHPVADRLRHQADVIDREVIGDDAPPAVRPELDPRPLDVATGGQLGDNGRDDPVRAHDTARLDGRTGTNDAVVTEDTAANGRTRLDHRSAIDDRILDDRALADTAARADGGDTADTRVFGDLSVVVDKRPTAQLGGGMNVTLSPHPDTVADLIAVDGRLDPALQNIGLRPLVVGQGRDGAPVTALGDTAIDRQILGEQLWEKLPLEAVLGIRRHLMENIPADHIDARVDDIGGRLIDRGFFRERGDTPLIIGDHDSILARVFRDGEKHGDSGAFGFVERDEARQIGIGENMTVQYQNGLLHQSIRDTANRPCRSEGKRLTVGEDRHAQFFAVAEAGLERLRHGLQAKNDIGDPMPFQKLKLILDQRLACERQHRARLARGQGIKGRTTLPGKYNGTHGNLVFL